MTELERPQPRTRPRPAADESVDPVQVPISAIAASTPPAASATTQTITPFPAEFVDRGPESTVQLNVRVKGATNATINRIQAKTGWTKRQIVERGTDLLAQHLGI